ncbi:hypothetical protein ABOM_007300 [Aspergillus bombycis]|uniref:DUF7730 domain-containing protein n=1 Tax=Aspergillus bombycis TaxID=109264 RepID=A0A1F7ZXD6_9EURO|nr:hypothetical protein ABOM_007300 [Aspergillus bombycis]OGM44116.1 hypothetical protein ABOM_007300 [Aspergillus bombycis]
MPFLLLNLPTELRLEIYHHLFGISPTTRLVLACLPGLPPCLNGCDNSSPTFVIWHFPPSTPDGTDYQGQSGYQPVEWAQRQGKIYSRGIFLAILVICKQVYNEAMPLFSSQTFFAMSGLINTTVSWLAGIGAQRRRCIRRLSFHYESVPSAHKSIGNDIQYSMRVLCEMLMDSDRLDVLL